MTGLRVFELIFGAMVCWPLALGALLLLGVKIEEFHVRRLALAHACTIAALASLSLIIPNGLYPDFFSPFGHLLKVGTYHFDTSLQIDRISTVYAGLVAVIYGVVIRFSFEYLHREPRFHRFFLLMGVCSTSLTIIAFSGSFDLFLAAWEAIGITSVLLIGFFHFNPRSAQNSSRAFIYYKTCDVALLLALVLLHHEVERTDFGAMDRAYASPHTVWIGLLILFASLAKSAQLPFSGWLHRAMEGPTASSALFYGALSIHLGPILLMRTQGVWRTSLVVTGAMFAVGILTALYGTLVGRTRADAKSSLAYATMAQVGFIYCEIAAGYTSFALFHCVAHAGLRTWQYLHSLSLLRDFDESIAVSTQLVTRRKLAPENWLPTPIAQKLYIHCLNLFSLDSALEAITVRPALKLLRFWQLAEDKLLAGSDANSDADTSQQSIYPSGTRRARRLRTKEKRAA